MSFKTRENSVAFVIYCFYAIIALLYLKKPAILHPNSKEKSERATQVQTRSIESPSEFQKKLSTIIDFYKLSFHPKSAGYFCSSEILASAAPTLASKFSLLQHKENFAI